MRHFAETAADDTEERHHEDTVHQGEEAVVQYEERRGRAAVRDLVRPCADFHADGMGEPDGDVLEPIEEQDLEDAPAEPDHADERDRIDEQDAGERKDAEHRNWIRKDLYRGDRAMARC